MKLIVLLGLVSLGLRKATGCCTTDSDCVEMMSPADVVSVDVRAFVRTLSRAGARATASDTRPLLFEMPANPCAPATSGGDDFARPEALKRSIA